MYALMEYFIDMHSSDEAGENGSTAEGGNGDQHEIQRGKYADSDQVGDREFVRVFQAVCHDEFLQK